MKHVDWLHSDHIILSNSSNDTVYKEFTKHMRSRKYSHLRLLISDHWNRNFVRYTIDNSPHWYECDIIQCRGKDYYLTLFNLTDKKDIIFIEKSYVKFGREEKLNKLLK